MKTFSSINVAKLLMVIGFSVAALGMGIKVAPLMGTGIIILTVGLVWFAIVEP